MRPKQSDVERRRNLFLDPEDFHHLYPGIAALIDSAARDVRDAHTDDEDARMEALVHAERFTLAANSQLVTLLGGGVDPVALLPLVRLAVEAVAHGPMPGGEDGC